MAVWEENYLDHGYVNKSDTIWYVQNISSRLIDNLLMEISFLRHNYICQSFNIKLTSINRSIALLIGFLGSFLFVIDYVQLKLTSNHNHQNNNSCKENE